MKKSLTLIMLSLILLASCSKEVAEDQSYASNTQTSTDNSTDIKEAELTMEHLALEKPKNFEDTHFFKISLDDHANSGYYTPYKHSLTYKKETEANYPTTQERVPRLQKYARLDGSVDLTKLTSLNDLPDTSLFALIDIDANPQIAPGESVIFVLHDTEFEVGETYDFKFDFQNIDDSTKHVVIEEKITY